METVNSITAAASKAIWGDATKEEPLSGETGDVKAGEPYDRGNVGEGAEPKATTTDTTTTDTIPAETTTAKTLIEPLAKDTASTPLTPSVKDDTTKKDISAIPTSSDEPLTSADIPGNAPQSLPIRSEHETSKTGVASLDDPVSAPATGPASSSIDDSTLGVGKKSDIDTSSDAPRTLEELAKSKPASGTGAAGITSAEDKEPSVQTESQGEGTGEQYVKSTGVKADGGNFDASAPGAGKEATRLLGEQGVHETTALPKIDATEKVSSQGSASGGKEKLSLKEKIKAKLHKHKD